MTTHGRLSVFSDENHILGGFATAAVRNKRPGFSVLCDVGANQIIPYAPPANCNIPGFYDRKPLYARGPSKLLKAKQENRESFTSNDFTMDHLLCDARSAATGINTPFNVGPLLPTIDFPMVIPPQIAELDRLAVSEEDQPVDDKFFTGLYGDSHYAHLRNLELKLRPRPDYMRRQKDISVEMRSVLVDWLVEVNEEYRQSDETLFLTVSLIDRFLSLMSVVRGKLQLVGTAAIFVAAKVEEIYPPQLADLVYITDDTYTTSQILRMEALLLKNLDFFIGNPHSLTFIQGFAIKAKLSRRVAHMAQYICELSLLNGEALAFRPSELAAAATVLALHHIEGNIDQWTEEIHEFSGIDSVQLQSAVNFLQTILLQAHISSHKAIRNKHANRKYSSVSLHPVRPTAPHVLSFNSF